MENIKKRLVFHFYIPPEGYKTLSNELHLRCLKKYAHIFDEILIAIAQDDVDKNEIIGLEKELIGIFNQKKITFKVTKNTYLRDSKTFYDEIATKMSALDGITFFAHNKGLTNISSGKFDKENIYKWVTALYYGCLEFYKEAEYALTEQREYAYGALFDIIDVCNQEEWVKDIMYCDLGKYAYLYTGTFFWLNTQCLKGYMERKGVELPQLSDRWYAENFLSNIVVPKFCTTRNGAYARNYIGGREFINELIKICFIEEDYKNLEDFHKKITEGL